MKILIIAALATLLSACGQPTQFDCIGTQTETMYANDKKDGITENTAKGFTLSIGKNTHYAYGIEFSAMNSEGAAFISGVSNLEGRTVNLSSRNGLTFDRNTQEIKMSRISNLEIKGIPHELHSNFTGKCAPSK